MAIDDILKRIEIDSRAAAGEILDAARRDAAAVEAEYEGKAERLKAELSRRSEKRAQEEERRLVVNEELEIRKARLVKKRMILERLYETASRRIRELPESGFRDIIKSLILEKAVSGTEEIVVSASQRNVFTGAFLADLNAAFPGGGRFTISRETGDFEWGVVLREGKRVVNLSLDVLFEQLRERIEPKLAAVLFPAGEEPEAR